MRTNRSIPVTENAKGKGDDHQDHSLYKDAKSCSAAILSQLLAGSEASIDVYPTKTNHAEMVSLP